ncbi:S46 family peptidase [Flavisolibacter ginsenosidimutans]|uniref:Dipeptidyl-peptidase n=1 Tax=Flavisolibacter ginsenosidimutans TaxID=661481 RepID=A0A5B8ULR7_9BACT|nr:S46 family peptidase [Flavisolibacter ginsenosidimutans]QEC56955.1 S46 family peptidase [Flavisolibacter ginsenosidimutans]
MKRTTIAFLLFVSFAFRAAADEGMWLPLLLGQQVYNDMVKKGLKLTKEQLYSINQPSVKDAILIFGSGCTGEIVSNQGLIFTNHHCGYDAIAKASTVEHNYLHDGFYAKNTGEEIPSQLSVQFLLRIDDVTKLVMDSLKNLTGAERAARQTQIIQAINDRMSDAAQSIETKVSPLFKGNQFLAFVYQRYTDIRLVGAPPEAFGKFGGDTDNWEWPRHTCDFSVFRVYATKDGKPTKYSAANIPLKPKWYLPVSLKGVREGDFSMIFGYPGSTNRYESSYGIQLSTDINNPSLVKLRHVRMKYMMDEMKKDPAIKLQLASSYASIANYWKFYKGETEELYKYDVFGQKRKEEEAFQKWATSKPEYANIFKDLKNAYDAWRPYAMQRMYINEGLASRPLLGSPLLQFAASLQKLETSLVKTGSTQAEVKQALDDAGAARQDFIKAENKPSDQNIVAAVLQMFYNDIPKDQRPVGFYEALRNEYGSLDKASTYQKYAEAVFRETMLLDDQKWNAFVRNPDANTLQQDLAYNLASAFWKNYQSKYYPLYQQFETKNNEWARLYLKGVMEENPKKIMYPDATFTMRVSYGKVAGYKPRDAVYYDYVTTSKGVLEKYKPGDYEFDLPKDAVEKLKAKDFGQYKDAKYNDLVTCFITTNDITGGNSGSPVMNGKGELIGLAFDGNYEALSHKLAFDKDLNRTINVDIRYVLWVIDKVGGAQNIIKELTLRKQ